MRVPKQLCHLFLLVSSASQILAHNDIFERQAITSYSPSQTSSCLNLVSSCFPTVSSCTPQFCSSCAAVGGPDFVSCCAGTSAAQCIATLLADPATLTAGPTATNDPNLSGCSSVLSLVSSCATATSSFTELDDGSQASCLCYTASGTETVYAPTLYDNAQASCAAWPKTADQPDYSDFAALAGFCTRVGNIRGTSASNAASSQARSTSGAAVSTRSVSVTSASSSRSQTQTIVSSSSSAMAAAESQRTFSGISWKGIMFVLGIGWLV